MGRGMGGGGGQEHLGVQACDKEDMR
jgi:hypothetical protein